MTFSLHPQLEADTHRVAALPLCEVLLMDDRRFPWCILVPRLADLRDLHDVPADSKTLFYQEIEQLSAALQKHSSAHKMNVAALGNVVAQLHVHVIARQPDDEAWPGPVWGTGSAQSYPPEQAAREARAIAALLTVT